MKKVVRMLGLCALVALAFTACKKDDTQKVTFTANVAQTTNDARTHAEYGTYLVWDDGDVIQIFNGAGNEMDFEAQTSSGLPGVAQFTATTNDEIEFVKDLETDMYTAFYPNAAVDGDLVRMEIPYDQTYVPQRSFASNLYPMVGWNMDEEGSYCNRFQFRSDAGFLNLSFTKLYEDQDQYLDEIIVTTTEADDYLTGYLVYDKEGNLQTTLAPNGFEGNGNQVRMKIDHPVELYYEAATDFTFVLPAGALYSGFTVQVKLEGELIETYVAQPRPNNVIAAQNYTVMIPMQLPQPPAPTDPE